MKLQHFNSDITKHSQSDNVGIGILYSNTEWILYQHHTTTMHINSFKYSQQMLAKRHLLMPNIFLFDA